MADISIPQTHDYYRITVVAPGASSPMFYNRLTFSRLEEVLAGLHDRGELLKKVEHVYVEVTVHDVTDRYSSTVDMAIEEMEAQTELDPAPDGSSP